MRAKTPLVDVLRSRSNLKHFRLQIQKGLAKEHWEGHGIDLIYQTPGRYGKIGRGTVEPRAMRQVMIEQTPGLEVAMVCGLHYCKLVSFLL
jgi:hypothetical protein